MKRSLPILFLLVLAAAGAAQESGDAVFAGRHAGMKNGIASRAAIEKAVQTYENELKGDPASLVRRAAVMKALYFLGRYTGASTGEQKAVCGKGKVLGEAGKTQILQKTGLSNFDKPEQAVAKLKDLPGAAEFFFWDGALIGQWALAYGKMAAAREGAAKVILNAGTITYLLDERMEDAGGHRVVGRLHHQTPRIPFITGWASNKEAMKHLAKAVELGPSNPMNYWFYGEVLMDEGKKAEAKTVLEKGAALPIRPEKLTEDTDSQNNIRLLLAKLK
jgi:tetratricopeptide (TPR) repeat protein